MTVPVKAPNARTAPVFRRGYIVFPSAVLVLSLVLTAFFYSRLPLELAYHFRGDGSPDRWMDRDMIILVLLVPQLILTLLATATVWGMTRLSARFPAQNGSRPEKIIRIIGNMVALPEIVLSFVMLDIFLFNSLRIHIMPVWAFAAIVMVTGGIVLGILFLKAFRDVRRPTQ